MKNKKKIAKIIGGIVGVGAICCIIPACVVSCGSSSTPTTNSQTGNDLIGTNVISNNATVTQGSYSSYIQVLGASGEMQTIDSEDGVSSGQVSSEMNQMYNFWESSTGSTSTYTFSLNQNITGSYKWYSLTSNNSNGTGYEAAGDNGWTSAIAEIISQDGAYLGSGTTYQWSGTIQAGGEMFVCQIQNSTGTYYSKIIWLYTANPATATANNSNSSSSNSSNSQTSSTDPLNLGSQDYTLLLDNSNLSSSSYGTYNVNANTSINLTLSISNFTESSFSNDDYEVQYVVTNQDDSSANYTSAWEPLSSASSWTFSFTPTGGSTTVTANFQYNSNPVNVEESNVGIYGYAFNVPSCQIAWANASVVSGGSDSISVSKSTSWWSSMDYQWQESTDGKTWTDISKASGTTSDIYNINYDVKDITNSTTQYRVKITNATNTNEFFYSNAITQNDSLISSTISFNNSTYQQEFESKLWKSAVISTNNTSQVYIKVALIQYGKPIINKTELNNLSGSFTFSYLTSDVNNYNNNTYYYGNDPFTINVSNLGQYLQSDGTLLIPINTNEVVQNLAAINTYLNQNYTPSQNYYSPCSVQFTVTQNGIQLNSLNTLSLQYETANISLKNNLTQINGIYYAPWNQSVDLTSANSLISFTPANQNNGQDSLQWEYSTNGTNWNPVSSNGNSTTYSATINEKTIYYRLQVTTNLSSDVVLYSNVIEISSSIPSATLQTSNGTSSITLSNFDAPTLNLKMNQYNSPIFSSSNIQVIYQLYDATTKTWSNLTKSLNFDSTSASYNQYIPVSGTNTIRAEYIYQGKIVQYTNSVTINEIDPTVKPLDGLNPSGNANNWISENGSTYTYTYGSTLQLGLSSTNIFNVSNYQITDVKWYEDINGTSSLVVNYNNNYLWEEYGYSYYGSGAYIDLSIRATAQSAQYYAVISYNPISDSTNYTMTTQPITIDTVNNGMVANLQLDTTGALNSAIQNVCPSAILGKYYFLNFPYQYVNNESDNPITTESGGTLSLNLNLNIFDNGSQVNTNTLSSQQSNWKITWYEQTYGNDNSNNEETWGASTVLAASKPITSANAWTYSTGNFQNGSIYRVRCLITESTGQMYSNWYYFGAIPQLKIGWMYTSTSYND